MINVLVSCTNKKSSPPLASLHLENYGSIPPENVQQRWKENLASAAPSKKACDLYQGKWYTVLRQDKYSSLNIQTHIISAGLGFLSSQTLIPSYSCTFTKNSIDSIPKAEEKGVAQQWWESLGGLEDFKKQFAKQHNPLLICALPNSYLQPIQQALKWFVSHFSSTNLIILCSGKHQGRYPQLKQSWISLEHRMSNEIGGSFGNLSVYALCWLLEQAETETDISLPFAKTVFANLSKKVANQPSKLTPGKKQTEQQVLTWLHSELTAKSLPSSATAALREFRKQGFGFEEKRFRKLYKSAITKVSEESTFTQSKLF